MTLTYDIANWMSLVDDAKLLSELSIPGTHDSAAAQRPGFNDERLTTQARTIANQLEGGVRFLDLRCGYVNKEFGLYHEDTSLHLSFTEVRDVCQQFLQDHPRETLVVSIKDEYTGDGNDSNVSFQQRFQQYVNETPGLWYLQNATPRLDPVRGKIVLFRRFPLDGTTQLGINAYDGFPSDTTATISGPGRPTLVIQDWYSFVSLHSVENLLGRKWAKVEELLNQAAKLTDPDALYVNFTSAAGRFDTASYPRPIARFINPQVNTYLTAHNQGRFGILPRDYESLFAGNVNTLIAHANVPYDPARFFFLKNKRDGDVIDVQDDKTAPGTPLIAFGQKTSRTGNQLWRFIVSGTPPYFFIRVQQADQLIEIKGANAAPGAALIGAPLKVPEGDNQLWMLVPSDETQQYFFITSRLNRGVITIDGPKQQGGTPLVVRPRKPSDNDDQLWSLVKSN